MKNSLDYEINQDYRCGYNAGFSDGRAAEWISVKDAKPDAGQKVTIYIEVLGGGLVDTATYRGGSFADTRWHFMPEQVTHWMPSPAAPEKTEGDD